MLGIEAVEVSTAAQVRAYGNDSTSNSTNSIRHAASNVIVVSIPVKSPVIVRFLVATAVIVSDIITHIPVVREKGKR